MSHLAPTELRKLFLLSSTLMLLGFLGLAGDTLYPNHNLEVLALSWIFAGMLQLVAAHRKTIRSRLSIQLPMVLLYIGGGLFLWFNPTSHQQSPALLIAVLFFLTSIFRLPLGLIDTSKPNWRWPLVTLTNILIFIGLSGPFASIYSQHPSCLMAIELTLQGWALLLLTRKISMHRFNSNSTNVMRAIT